MAPGKVLLADKVVDSRKTELQGLAARLSWSSNPVLGLGYTAGLQIGGSTFRQEYIGDISGANSATPTKLAFRDTYNATPTKTTVAVSPYVGVSYRFNEFSSLELNLLALRYKAIDYVHQAGYGTVVNNTDVSRDSLVSTNRTQAHIELGYIFRF